MSTDYLDHMQTVANEDVEGLKEAHNHYGRSCLKRGGSGLYHAFARKMDRLEESAAKFGYDIFKAIEADNRAEGIIDDIRDLRRYLNIVESEARAMQLPAAMTKQRDNIQAQGDSSQPVPVTSTAEQTVPVPAPQEEGMVHYGDMGTLIVETFKKVYGCEDPYAETVRELDANKIKISLESVKKTVAASGWQPPKPIQTPAAVMGPGRVVPSRMVPRQTKEQERPFGFDPEQDVA